MFLAIPVLQLLRKSKSLNDILINQYIDRSINQSINNLLEIIQRRIIARRGKNNIIGKNVNRQYIKQNKRK